ncbi:hypothetical protein JIR001_26870 [Polycladomyces abyssicola]|uniref:Methyl-accepting chemotaxis protein n=1 Tax=Polycladomyces abyssicola TaxID=1125966 RepID=A0A8D5ZLU8_9BACL|nr:hypothetical protein [Polycladomyces abyssicola]BCU82904.1 hypothetical protein JIR001_26870 [Polycladomyces abyssicola]
MIRKFISILGILLLSGVLINGITMTQHLKRIHSGLEDNLQSIQQLNQVQAAIIDKNGELAHMVRTVQRIDRGLNATIVKTDQTLTLLTTVVDYNADSLRLNDGMLGYSNNSKQKIQAISSSLQELSPYMQQLDQMLKQMRATAAADRQHMEDILQSTREMNKKTPGVSLK